MELTGGNYEFVIATHVDKKHVHNHIIFNATDTVDYHKFRWENTPFFQLKNISDKVADFHGAKIQRNEKRNSHAKYQDYRQNNYRNHLKERLKFLVTRASNLEDFLSKATLLKIDVNFSRKFATYCLRDFPQERSARDTTLLTKKERQNEHRKYSYEGIIERIAQNTIQLSEREFLEQWHNFQNDKIKFPEIKCLVEPWQIEKETMTGIYVRVKMGKRNTGLVKIPDYKFDQLPDGNFEVFITTRDQFFFFDDKGKKTGKSMRGQDVIAQLSEENRYIPKHQHSAMRRIREMTAVINLLSKHQVKGAEAFLNLGGEFVDDLHETELALEQLDQKISKLTESVKFDQGNAQKLELLTSLQSERRNLQTAYRGVIHKLDIMEKFQENLETKNPLKTDRAEEKE